MKKILLLYSFLIFACSGGGDSDEGSEDIIGDNFIVSAEFAELFNNIGGQSTVGNNQILKKSFSGEQNGKYSNTILNVVDEILSMVEKTQTYTNIFSNIDCNF